MFPINQAQSMQASAHTARLRKLFIAPIRDIDDQALQQALSDAQVCDYTKIELFMRFMQTYAGCRQGDGYITSAADALKLQALMDTFTTYVAPLITHLQLPRKTAV